MTRLNLFQSLAIIALLWMAGFYTYAVVRVAHQSPNVEGIRTTFLNHARAVAIASEAGQYMEVRK